MYRLLIFFVLSVVSGGFLCAQETNRDLFRWDINDKNSSIGISLLSQVWVRYIENNPNFQGVEQYPDFDLGLRRNRIGIYSTINDKFYFYTQFGVDGVTYRSGQKPQVTLMTAQTEYAILKDKLNIGLGLINQNGPSRCANSNPGELLTIDIPGFVNPFSGSFDEEGRQFGVFAKGSLTKLNYRFAMTKPFEFGTDTGYSEITVPRINENFAFKGYAYWQFFETEKQHGPFLGMTKNSGKKTLNLGSGFYFHPQAMLGTNGLTGIWYNALSLATDVYFYIPGKRKGDLTAYVLYTYNDFGPGYLCSVPVMNVSRMTAAGSLPQGAGNSEWDSGTGHIVRGETGWLLPQKWIKTAIQPYGAFTWKSFEALDQNSLQFDAGLNFVQPGNNLKWTIQYSNRPVYKVANGATLVYDYKSQVTLQAQFYF